MPFFDPVVVRGGQTGRLYRILTHVPSPNSPYEGGGPSGTIQALDGLGRVVGET